MRTKLGLAMALVIGILSVAGALRKAEPKSSLPTTAADERLIVHEWGTFTNFSSSNGVQHKFRPLVDNLPAFIHKTARLNPLIKGDLMALQRMETPVTYFYANSPRQVDVRVGFPKGLLTEFYPPAKEKVPSDWARRFEQADASLTWRLKLHPAGDRSALTLPRVQGDDHYGFARATDSAIVEVSDPDERPHYEKFLFYRGVGDFSLPLRLEASSHRRFRAINDGPDVIESLFLVMIDDDGLRYCRYSKIAAHGSLDMAVPDSLATADELSDRMAEALVSSGLYENEARAMVHTWRSSWFSEPGARLFYILPRRLTNEILPLTVQPAPDEVVRVLVGRMEVLTPEAADRLVALIREHGDCLPEDVEPLRRELKRLGRFAEPALTHVASSQTDPAVLKAIGRILGIARRVP